MQEYRQNVGLVIIKNGLIFAGFRADKDINSTDGWQMPQGGIEKNEDILTAGYRELYEETGIIKDKVKFVAQIPESIKYDFTAEVLKKNKNTKWRKYKGQEQYWLVFEFLGEDKDINLQVFLKEIEFQKFDWKTVEFLQNNVYKMKQEAYTKVFNWMRKEKLIK